MYTYLQLPRWSCLQTSLLILQTLRPCDQVLGLVQLCATRRGWFGIRDEHLKAKYSIYHIYHHIMSTLNIYMLQIIRFYSSARHQPSSESPYNILHCTPHLCENCIQLCDILGSLATWVRHSCWNPGDRKPMVNSRRLKPRTLLGKWVTSEAGCLDASAQNWRSCLILVEEILCMRNSIQPH